MSRRIGLPGASELFRATAPSAPLEPSKNAAPVQASGRKRHDEKITVYVSSEELLALEHLRLALRGEYGIVADRGRIVRAAIADMLTDIEENGADSRLIARLQS